MKWNLQITDTLGTGLLSIVERLSLSRRLSPNIIVNIRHSERLETSTKTDDQDTGCRFHVSMVYGFTWAL